MSLHRLDVCTLTIDTAWKAYLAHRETNRIAAVMALRKHFERIDEKCIAKQYAAFFKRNELDHRARGLIE